MPSDRRPSTAISEAQLAIRDKLQAEAEKESLRQEYEAWHKSWIATCRPLKVALRALFDSESPAKTVDVKLWASQLTIAGRVLREQGWEHLLESTPIASEELEWNLLKLAAGGMTEKELQRFLSQDIGPKRLANVTWQHILNGMEGGIDSVYTRDRYQHFPDLFPPLRAPAAALPCHTAAKGRANDSNRPGEDRMNDILEAIRAAGTPLTRHELVEQMGLKVVGKLGHNLAWMVKADILKKCRYGYWPANEPLPE